MKAFKTIAAVAALAVSSLSYGDDFSFTGNLTGDDDVQFFTFSVGAASNVTLRTWSYAGGTNAAGNAIARGGFDPILALFNSSGVLLNQNDDGGFPLVDADAVTGEYYDTYLTEALGAGTYTVAVMQYSNFASGPNLSNGFQGSGTSGFVDVTGDRRTSAWAFDILNVNSANTGVPDGGNSLLLVCGSLGLIVWARRRFASAA